MTYTHTLLHTRSFSFKRSISSYCIYLEYNIRLMMIPWPFSLQAFTSTHIVNLNSRGIGVTSVGSWSLPKEMHRLKLPIFPLMSHWNIKLALHLPPRQAHSSSNVAAALRINRHLPRKANSSGLLSPHQHLQQEIKNDGSFFKTSWINGINRKKTNSDVLRTAKSSEWNKAGVTTVPTFHSN